MQHRLIDYQEPTFFEPKIELERAIRFIAGEERNILELPLVIRDLKGSALVSNRC